MRVWTQSVRIGTLHAQQLRLSLKWPPEKYGVKLWYSIWAHLKGEENLPEPILWVLNDVTRILSALKVSRYYFFLCKQHLSPVVLFGFLVAPSYKITQTSYYLQTYYTIDAEGSQLFHRKKMGNLVDILTKSIYNNYGRFYTTTADQFCFGEGNDCHNWIGFAYPV